MAGAVDADPLSHARLPVLDEYVRRIVVICRHEVRGVGLEGHITAVGAEHRAAPSLDGTARLISLGAVRGATDKLCRPGHPVVNENVP